MEYLEIVQLLDAPAIKLLRSPNAAMILGFLYRVFKRSFRPVVSEGELRSILEVYLAELAETSPNSFIDSAANYLADWRDSRHAFVRRSYSEGQEEPVFELTSGAEKALLWVESLRRTEFIGTESRLASIFAGLDEILRYASDDVDERISLLIADAARIEDEIERIRSTGRVEKYSPVKLNERFARLIATARELLSDFRAVEENFQHIAQEIAENHVRPGVTKGAVLGQMLDSHDALKESSQGQSFYSFRELLLSPERQRHFDDAVEKAQNLPILAPEMRSSALLTDLISRLLIEDETVLGSTQRVSANLRRVLDTSDISERRRVSELIRDIAGLALRIKDSVDYKGTFFELNQTEPAYSGMSRTAWREPAKILALNVLDPPDDDGDLDELRRFKNLPQVRLSELRKNVETCLDQQDNIILATVLEAYPPKNGIIDVVGYLIIAAREDRHYLGDTETTRIELPSGCAWDVPAVLFTRGSAK